MQAYRHCMDACTAISSKKKSPYKSACFANLYGTSSPAVPPTFGFFAKIRALFALMQQIHLLTISHLHMIFFAEHSNAEIHPYDTITLSPMCDSLQGPPMDYLHIFTVTQNISQEKMKVKRADLSILHFCGGFLNKTVRTCHKLY